MWWRGAAFECELMRHVDVVAKAFGLEDEPQKPEQFVTRYRENPSGCITELAGKFESLACLVALQTPCPVVTLHS